LPAATVRRVTPTPAAAKTAAVAASPARPVSPDSLVAPETREHPVSQAVLANPSRFHALSPSRLRAARVPEVSQETPAHQARPVSPEPQETPASPEATRSQDHQDLPALPETLDSPADQELPETPEPRLRVRPLRRRHLARLESKDSRDSQDTPEDLDSPATPDSPDRRDPPAPLETQEAKGNPGSQETPVNPDSPDAPESARNTVLWTEACSSRTAHDGPALKRRIRFELKDGRSVFPTTTTFLTFLAAAGARTVFLLPSKTSAPIL
jgi:hypothetical protein